MPLILRVGERPQRSGRTSGPVVEVVAVAVEGR